MNPVFTFTTADLRAEHRVEYETRLGMGWAEKEAREAADEHVMKLEFEMWKQKVNEANPGAVQ